MMILTQNENIDFLGGLSVSAVCVLIVFAILILMGLIVNLLQFLNGKKKPVAEEKVEAPALQPVVYQSVVKKYITLEEITDEDMMVAALIATIEYHDEIFTDVRVVSIRQME